MEQIPDNTTQPETNQGVLISSSRYLWLFLVIFIIFGITVVVGYLNYTPKKQLSVSPPIQEALISNKDDTGTVPVKMDFSGETNNEPDIIIDENTGTTSIETEEVPSIMNDSNSFSHTSQSPSETCPDGACNNGCASLEYWDGTSCREAGMYKTHSSECVTNTASELPDGYFVSHFLWDSGDCAGGDYNMDFDSGTEGRQVQKKCKSGEMICKKYYADSCVLGSGICTCIDSGTPSNEELSQRSDMTIVAGGYSGKKTNYQIDDSGESATLFTVRINYTEKPVTLILGAYEPSIWDISLSEGTKIKKIILGGYYGQKVAGIASSTPIEEHIHQYNQSSDYFYIVKGGTLKSSLKKYGDIGEITYADENGFIQVGDANAKWIHDPTNTIEKYYKQGDNLSGKAGLDILVQKGILRIATKEDADKWFNQSIASPMSLLSRQEGYPITNSSVIDTLRKKYTPGFGSLGGIHYYVALQDFTLPGGMYWAFAFYIPKGVQVTGDISNGSIYDFDSMLCRGSCSLNDDN